MGTVKTMQAAAFLRRDNTEDAGHHCPRDRFSSFGHLLLAEFGKAAPMPK